MKDEWMQRGEIPMTKMEIRAAALSYLELYSAKTLLDIGAGTGSVSIEAGMRHPNLRIDAIEREMTGVELIRLNAEALKVTNITAYCGQAPYNELEGQYDRVFLGGTGRQMVAIIDWLIEKHLTPGAIVVLTAITLETLNEGLTLLTGKGFESVEGTSIQASRLEKLGTYHYFKPLNPCYILKGVWKP